MIEPRALSSETGLIEAILLSEQQTAPGTAGAADLPRVVSPRYRKLGVRPVEQPFEQSTTASYTLGDFTKYQDREFVIAAYRGMLGRVPDVQGGAHYLSLLRSGMAKPEILGRLRYSVEGNRVKVKVPGLLVRHLFYLVGRIPVLGRLFHVVVLVFLLPETLQYLRRTEADAARNATHTLEQIAALDANIARQFGGKG